MVNAISADLDIFSDVSLIESTCGAGAGVWHSRTGLIASPPRTSDSGFSLGEITSWCIRLSLKHGQRSRSAHGFSTNRSDRYDSYSKTELGLSFAPFLLIMPASTDRVAQNGRRAARRSHHRTRPRALATADRAVQHPRHRGGVVRLPDLRHRHRAGVQQAVLPQHDPARRAPSSASAPMRVGFLARPLGAAIFGHFGDRIGRKAMLAATIVIMGLGTFLIGLLPTYAQIGVAAPLLLVALRFLQGIGLGGEWGGAVLMVVENAPAAAPRPAGQHGADRLSDRQSGGHRHVRRCSRKLPDAEFIAWGWRVPFLISIAAGRRRPVHPAAPGRRRRRSALERRNALARMPLVGGLHHAPPAVPDRRRPEDLRDRLGQHRRRVRHLLRDRQARPAARPDPERRC